MAEVYCSILLPILETIGVCDTLAVVLHRWTRHWALVKATNHLFIFFSCTGKKNLFAAYLFWADLLRNSAFSPICTKQCGFLHQVAFQSHKSHSAIQFNSIYIAPNQKNSQEGAAICHDRSVLWGGGTRQKTHSTKKAKAALHHKVSLFFFNQ